MTGGPFEGQRFRLLRELGEGVTGTVHEVRDGISGERVALKVLRTVTGDAVIRFKREFRVLADLQHPNLVRLGELFEADGCWFFTMELVEGTDLLAYVGGAGQAEGPTLADPVAPVDAAATTAPRPQLERTGGPAAADGPPDLTRVRAVAAQLAQALTALHRAGLVHRDVKPSNVRVTEEGRLVLLDFGFALVSDRLTDQSADVVVGTPAYMPPEQALSGRVGPEADWYAFGALLFHLLTGRPPFVGNPMQVLVEKQRYEPPPPGQLVPGVPGDLEALCVDLMRIDPQSRPRGGEVLARLGVADPGAAIASGLFPGGSLAGGPVTFVGRTTELARLEGALAELRSGRSSTLHLIGASGMGKSQLVQAFVDRVASDEEVVVVRGRCYERESVAFKAFDGVMEDLARWLATRPRAEVATLRPTHASLLQRTFPVLRRIKGWQFEEPPLLIEPQEQRARVFSSARDLLRRLGGRHHVVMVIDDLQWADADSLALLAALLQPPDAPRLLLLAISRRSEELQGLPVPVESLEVGPLGREDASALAETLLRTFGLDPAIGPGIAASADGHPFFIQELVRLAETGLELHALVLDDAIWLRVLGLEPSAHKALGLLAISGAPLSEAVVAHALGLQPREAQRALAVLRAGHLIQRASGGGGLVETTHDRVRQVVHHHLAPVRRRATHRALARALEELAPGDVRALSLHWAEGGSPQRAAQFAVQAAQQAETVLALEQAATFYLRALELWPPDDPAEATPLWTALGDVLAAAGRGRAAAGAYQSGLPGASVAMALELKRRAAGELLKSGHIEEGIAALGDVLAAAGLPMFSNPRRALPALALSRLRLRLRGLRYVRRDESQLSPEVLRRIDVCWTTGIGLGMVDVYRSVYYSSRMVELALAAGEPKRLARALIGEVMMSSLGGRRTLARTRALTAMAAGLADGLDEPYPKATLPFARAMSAYQLGHFEEARELAERSEKELRERCRGVGWEIASSQAVIIWSHFWSGRLGALSRLVPACLRESAQRGDLYGATNCRVGLAGAAWLVDGDLVGAASELEDARRMGTLPGFHLQHYWRLFAAAQIDLYLGHGLKALTCFEQAWRELEATLLLRVAMVRKEALHLRGRVHLAAYLEQPDAEQLAIAHKLVRRLLKEGDEVGSALARLLEAGVHALEQRDDTAERLVAAETACAAAGMEAFRRAAEWHRGRLIGGDEGRRLVDDAEAWARGERVADWPSFARLLLPGFPG